MLIVETVGIGKDEVMIVPTAHTIVFGLGLIVMSGICIVG